MAWQIDYASRRGEVWAWYWHEWRARLWRAHVGVFLLVSIAIAFYAKGAGPLTEAVLVRGAFAGALAALWMPLYPMIAFKPNPRRLVMDATGVRMHLRGRTTTRTWSDIAAVRRYGSLIALTLRAGGAFVVPARAFATAAEQDAFIRDAEAAVAANGPG